jgi:hypothetical protein
MELSFKHTKTEIKLDTHRLKFLAPKAKKFKVSSYLASHIKVLFRDDSVVCVISSIVHF